MFCSFENKIKINKLKKSNSKIDNFKEIMLWFIDVEEIIPV